MARTVAEVFHAHTGRLIDKWAHYLDIYQKHFARYVDTPVRVLEIGVSHGGSLQLWKQYFGPKAEIIGLDIDPRCEDYEEDQIQIYTGDQSKLVDSPKLDAFVHLGPFDIVIDDGSHVREHQEASFKALWPSTRGVYLIEDCHDGYPAVMPIGGLRSLYPWVYVMERPKRLIRGTPSRELRQDEILAIKLYGHD
jgi:cephalosporin hydroxylase